MRTAPYKGYVGYVEQEHFDRFFGRVEGIQTIICFEATCLPDVQPIFEAAIDDYLAWCEEWGRTPDAPESQHQHEWTIYMNGTALRCPVCGAVRETE